MRSLYVPHTTLHRQLSLSLCPYSTIRRCRNWPRRPRCQPWMNSSPRMLCLHARICWRSAGGACTVAVRQRGHCTRPALSQEPATAPDQNATFCVLIRRRFFGFDVSNWRSIARERCNRRRHLGVGARPRLAAGRHPSAGARSQRPSDVQPARWRGRPSARGLRCFAADAPAAHRGSYGERDWLETAHARAGENFYAVEELGGTKYFTAVYADTAVAPVCVSCHNDHKDSPRRDFEMGDVMGGVIIRIPIEG